MLHNNIRINDLCGHTQLSCSSRGYAYYSNDNCGLRIGRTQRNAYHFYKDILVFLFTFCEIWGSILLSLYFIRTCLCVHDDVFRSSRIKNKFIEIVKTKQRKKTCCSKWSTLTWVMDTWRNIIIPVDDISVCDCMDVSKFDNAIVKLGNIHAITNA